MVDIAPRDWTKYKVVQVTDDGVWLLFQRRLIIASDGSPFGGYYEDFPQFVRHEDMHKLPLPETDKRKVRWAKRLARRLDEKAARDRLQGMTVKQFVDQVYASVIAERRVESRPIR